MKLSSWASLKLCLSENGTLSTLLICSKTYYLKVSPPKDIKTVNPEVLAPID